MTLKPNNKHDGAIPTYGINAMSSMVTTIGAPSLRFINPFINLSISFVGSLARTTKNYFYETL